jgi:predicted sugar kinase
VGQSSWGPCVFAIARNDETAQQLVTFLQSEYGDRCEVGVTQADNQGATILSSKPQTVFESQ